MFLFSGQKINNFFSNASNTKPPKFQCSNQKIKNLRFSASSKTTMETKTKAKHSTKPKNTTQNRMESTDHIGLLTVNERNIQWFTNSQLSVHIHKLVFRSPKRFEYTKEKESEREWENWRERVNRRKSRSCSFNLSRFCWVVFQWTQRKRERLEQP